MSCLSDSLRGREIVLAGGTGGLGSALAAPGYYYDDPGYYYAPGPDVYGAADPSAEAYCSQRYRSYDPASGTYLGYDGMRHPCP